MELNEYKDFLKANNDEYQYSLYLIEYEKEHNSTIFSEDDFIKTRINFDEKENKYNIVLNENELEIMKNKKINIIKNKKDNVKMTIYVKLNPKQKYALKKYGIFNNIKILNLKRNRKSEK